MKRVFKSDRDKQASSKKETHSSSSVKHLKL